MNFRKRELLFFALAGTLGFVVDYGITMICIHFFQLPPMLARIFAFAGAVYTTWLFNVRLSFRRRVIEGAQQSKFITYFFSMLLGLVLNYLVFGLVLYWPLPLSLSQHLFVAVACGSLAGMLLNFFNCHKFLFKHKM